MNERQRTRQKRFEVLLHEHRRIVFKVAASYARTVDDRNDLAQEIAAQLWRAFPSYDESRRFSTWMFKVALNVGISFARCEDGIAARLDPLDDETFDRPAAAAAEAPDERLGQLHAFIAQLDPLNRALIVLYLEDRSYAEMAEILGISETNVATRINRIKQRLRTQMTNDGTLLSATPTQETAHGTR